jgi:hypothetical protein
MSVRGAISCFDSLRDTVWSTVTRTHAVTVDNEELVNANELRYIPSSEYDSVALRPFFELLNLFSHTNMRQNVRSRLIGPHMSTSAVFQNDTVVVLPEIVHYGD